MKKIIKTNRVTFYNRNFSYKGVEPEYIWAIWYPMNSPYSYQYQINSFYKRKDLEKYLNKLGVKLIMISETEGYTDKSIIPDFKNKILNKSYNNIWSKAYDFTKSQEYRNKYKKELENFCKKHEKYIALGMTDADFNKAKKFKEYSNGYLVDCYFITTPKEVRIYRPNTNYKKYYKPLPINQSIEYRKRNGWA